MQAYGIGNPYPYPITVKKRKHKESNESPLLRKNELIKIRPYPFPNYLQQLE